MGNREYIEIFKERPPQEVGDTYRVYLGHGFFVDGVVIDIRQSNNTNDWIMKIRCNPKDKFTYK